MKFAQALVHAGETQPPVRVDDWPNPSRHMKTIMLYTQSFVGEVVFQASIVAHPTDDDWFEVRREQFMPFEHREEKTRNRLFHSRDRYIWMRAIVNGIGRVDRIMVL